MFLFGLALNVYVWDRCKVPWQQIFGAGHDSKITHRELIEGGCLLLTLGLVTLLSLQRSDLPGPFTSLPAYVHPLFLYAGALMLLFSPLKRHFQERFLHFLDNSEIFKKNISQ